MSYISGKLKGGTVDEFFLVDGRECVLHGEDLNSEDSVNHMCIMSRVCPEPTSYQNSLIGKSVPSSV